MIEKDKPSGKAKLESLKRDFGDAISPFALSVPDDGSGLGFPTSSPSGLPPPQSLRSGVSGISTVSSNPDQQASPTSGYQSGGGRLGYQSDDGGGLSSFPLQSDGGARMNKLVAAQQRKKVMEELAPKTDMYLKLFAEYAELRKELERQKDLLHAVIVTRLDESQGPSHSLTSVARAKIAKQLKNEAKKRKQQQDENKEKEDISVDRIGISLLSDDPSGHRDQLLNHSSMLTPIEECLSRLYMRPCYMHKLFDIYAVDVRKAINEQNNDRAQRLCDEFTSFLYSIYDTHQDKDLRLFQVFLRSVLQKHIMTLSNPEELLAPNSLEWSIFLRFFIEGRIRRPLADILQNAVTEIGDFDSNQTPAGLFHRFVVHSNVEDIRKAMFLIRERSNELFTKFLLEKTFHALMQIMGMPLELLYTACTRAPISGWSNVFGKRILSILSECIQQDLPYQLNRQMLSIARKQKKMDVGKRRGAQAPRSRPDQGRSSDPDPNSPHDGKLSWLSGRKVDVELDSQRQSELDKQIESLRYIFLNLQSETKLKQEICATHKGITERIIDTADHGSTRRNVRTASIDRTFDPQKLQKFEGYLRNTAKDRELYESANGSRVSSDRELYSDYLDLRTRFRRRMVIIPVSALKFILMKKKQLVPSLEEHKNMDWDAALDCQYEMLRVPCRLDSFHVDWRGPPVRCTDCGFVHPECAELKARSAITSSVVDGSNPDSEHRFSTEDLFDLLTIFQQPVCQSLITAGGDRDEVWKKVQEEVGKSQNSNAIHVVTALRQLSQRYDDTLVFFGDYTDTGVRADSLNPRIIYQILYDLNVKQQSDLEMESYKGSVISNCIEILHTEIKTTIDLIAQLKKEFTFKSQPHNMMDFLQLIEGTKPPNERARNRLSAKLKTFAAIKVFQEKGVVTQLSYKVLVKRKILAPIEGIKPSRSSPFGNKDQKEFVSSLRFLFITTDSPDLVEFKLTRKTQTQGSTKRSDLLLNGELSLRDLASESPTCHTYRYDPTGDRVTIQHVQTIIFNPLQLLAFLKQLPRPRHNLGAQADLGGGGSTQGTASIYNQPGNTSTTAPANVGRSAARPALI